MKMAENVDEKSQLLLAQSKDKPKGCCQQRNVLAVLGFSGFFMSYVLRVSFNVALVAMVNNTQTLNTSHPSECPVDVKDNSTAADSSPTGEFDWSPQTQGTILGSFYYGYIITQIPGGLISERIGGKWPFGVGVLLTGILTLLTPLAARADVSLLVTLRVLEGLGEGITIGAYYALIGKWSPPLERSFMVSLGYVGTEMGTVIAMPITGWLCKYGFNGGWPSAFYIFGSATCVWFIFWAALIASSPAEHPRISDKEKNYIIKMIGDSSKTKMAVPWKTILTSPTVLAMALLHTSAMYLFYTILTDIPIFMSTILHFDIGKNGLLSSLPALAYAIVGVISGYIADWTLAKGYLRLLTVRKLCTAIANTRTMADHIPDRGFPQPCVFHSISYICPGGARAMELRQRGKRADEIGADITDAKHCKGARKRRGAYPRESLVMESLFAIGSALKDLLDDLGTMGAFDYKWL